MQVVLDTNVLVSGLLNPDGAPGRVLDLILLGELQILYDDRIIAEYADVLAREQFGFSRDLTDAIIGYLRLSGIHVTALPIPEEITSDHDDTPFAEVAIAGNADLLVTGNQRHFSRLVDRGARVVSPDDMLRLFRPQ